jgi:hypothetical protein
MKKTRSCRPERDALDNMLKRIQKQQAKMRREEIKITRSQEEVIDLQWSIRHLEDKRETMKRKLRRIAEQGGTIMAAGEWCVEWRDTDGIAWEDDWWEGEKTLPPERKQQTIEECWSADGQSRE